MLQPRLKQLLSRSWVRPPMRPKLQPQSPRSRLPARSRRGGGLLGRSIHGCVDRRPRWLGIAWNIQRGSVRNSEAEAREAHCFGCLYSTTRSIPSKVFSQFHIPFALSFISFLLISFSPSSPFSHPSCLSPSSARLKCWFHRVAHPRVFFTFFGVAFASAAAEEEKPGIRCPFAEIVWLLFLLICSLRAQLLKSVHQTCGFVLLLLCDFC